MLSDFFITTGVVLTLLTGSHFLRTSLAKTLAPGSLVLGLLLEAIATFELCAVSFEQGLYYEFYGITAFHISLFVVCLWRFYSWRDVSTAPYSHLERWLDGVLGFGPLLLYIVAELVAGALVYEYLTKLIWSLDLATHHSKKLQGFVVQHCRTAVQVNYLVGAFIEGLGTFCIEMIFYFLSTLRGVPHHLLHMVRSAVITGFVYAALFTTGGFFAPILATVLQFGCTGITAWQHFVVYWIGPTLGSLTAVYLVKAIRPPPGGAPPRRPSTSAGSNGAAAESRKDQ